MKLKKLLLSLLIIILSFQSVYASKFSTSVWAGAKTTSTYSTKPIFGSSISDNFLTFSLEQIGLEQTKFTTNLNFKTNKTFRQEVNISSLIDFEDWVNANISYLIGQDLRLSFFYLNYRIGIQLGINHITTLKHTQRSVCPTLYLDTGVKTKYLNCGIKIGTITLTESSFQTIPIINPYMSIPINKFAIVLSTEFKLSDYLPDKVFPLISLATRVGISYTGGDK